MKINTKSKKVNKSWLNDHVNDPYVKLAQKEGYRARAAYKLKEIDETLGLIRPGHRVVDLGSAPGAWSQYVRRKLSPQGAAVGELNGTIISIDLLPMEPIEGVQFLQGDFREAEVLDQLEALVARTGIRPHFGRDAQMHTTVKLRIIGRQQQLLRLDFENEPDHEALAQQWQALRAVLLAVIDRQPARLEAAAVQAFAEHYRAHIALEEGELFPMAERWLSAQTLEAIGRTMRRRRGEG